MLNVINTSRFMKDVKRMKKRGKRIFDLLGVVDLLIEQQPLQLKHHDHKLSGIYEGHRECHIDPDWLLIYRVEGQQIRFVRTGTHADLFNL